MGQILQGVCALVTGGTSGIGKAIALAYAQEGAKVAIFGTNAEKAKVVQEEARNLTGNSEAIDFYCVDVAKTREVEEAIQAVSTKFNKIDILVNNAGITRDQLLLKMSEEDWDRVLETNLKSCYNTSKPVIRGMIKARKGKIINVSSVVALRGSAGQVNYAASKAGMIGFTKALAREVSSRGILVNCIAPGFIETRMTEEIGEKKKEEYLTRIPLGRMGVPADIAGAAIFLGSSWADYITGQVLVVDGGFAM